MAYTTFISLFKNAEYKCDTNCGMKHLFSKKKRNRCKRIKACACDCKELGSIHPSLVEGCIGSCNSNEPPIDSEDFLCNQIGGEQVFDQFGVERCGFSFHDSTSFKIVEFEQKAAEKSKLKSALIIGGLLLLSLFGLFFIARLKRKA